MAKMACEFDTETKKMTASIDGKPVANVVAVQGYPSYSGEDGESSFSFVCRSTDEGTGITEMRQLFASESKPAKAALADKSVNAFPSVEFPGMVEVLDTKSESKAHKDIAKGFGYQE